MRDSDDDLSILLISDILGSIPSLDTLDLDVQRSAFDNPLRLTQLSGLQKLTLNTTQRNSLANVLEPMALVVRNSPELMSLHLVCHDQDFDADSPSLHHLLSSPTEPLRLIELSLTSYGVYLDATIIPHLRFLRSLTFRRDVTRIPQVQMVANQIVKSYPQLNGLSSTDQEIWDTFRREGIHLEAVSVDRIEDGLLSYLASYSGLRRLTIDNAGADSETASNRLADIFFQSALVPHMQSLVALSCPASFEGRWCFGTHNTGVITQFHLLRSLCMSVVTLENAGKYNETVVSFPSVEPSPDTDIYRPHPRIPRNDNPASFPAQRRNPSRKCRALPK